MRKELLIAQFAAAATATQPVAEGRRRDLVFYSGAEIERYDFWNDEHYTIQFSMKDGDFDLSGLENAPLLKDHRAWSVDAQVGHIESPRVEKKVAMATAVFAETADVQDLWEKVEAGHVRNVSMGVNIRELELRSKPKEKKRYMALGWAPYEISVVPIGADPAASFQLSQQESLGDLPPEVRKFLRQLYKEHLAKAEQDAETPIDLAEITEALAQDPAQAGAASIADNRQRERVLSLMRLRQRQYGFSHR